MNLYSIIVLIDGIPVSRKSHHPRPYGENFHGREQLADSVNHLLLVGFYLINIGFVCLALRYGAKPTEVVVGAVEFLSTKIGLVIVLLGFMHFFNMRMLVRFRESRLFGRLAPEVRTA